MTKIYNDPFYNVDYNAITDGTKGWGVKSGLNVSEDSPQGMDVDVAAGTALINKIEYVETGITNLVISAAHATLPRRDIIIYDATAGNPAVVTGIAASEPIPPDITSGDILLAVINIPAAVTVITNTDIEDGRIDVSTDDLFFTGSGDISATRALATNYQNTNNKVMYVCAMGTHTTTTSFIRAYVDSSATPTTIVSVAQASRGAGSIIFMVPVGYYYRVTLPNVGGGFATLSEWYESY